MTRVDNPPLGGWRARTERMKEGESCIRIDKGEATWPGARTRVRVEIDVDIDHPTAAFLNPLIQNVLDGFAAGAYDIVGTSLIELELIKESERDV